MRMLLFALVAGGEKGKFIAEFFLSSSLSFGCPLVCFVFHCFYCGWCFTRLPHNQLKTWGSIAKSKLPLIHLRVRAASASRSAELGPLRIAPSPPYQQLDHLLNFVLFPGNILHMLTLKVAMSSDVQYYIVFWSRLVQRWLHLLAPVAATGWAAHMFGFRLISHRMPPKPFNLLCNNFHFGECQWPKAKKNVLTHSYAVYVFFIGRCEYGYNNKNMIIFSLELFSFRRFVEPKIAPKRHYNNADKQLDDARLTAPAEQVDLPDCQPFVHTEPPTAIGEEAWPSTIISYTLHFTAYCYTNTKNSSALTKTTRAT